LTSFFPSGVKTACFFQNSIPYTSLFFFFFGYLLPFVAAGNPASVNRNFLPCGHCQRVSPTLRPERAHVPSFLSPPVFGKLLGYLFLVSTTSVFDRASPPSFEKPPPPLLPCNVASFFLLHRFSPYLLTSFVTSPPPYSAAFFLFFPGPPNPPQRWEACYRLSFCNLPFFICPHPLIQPFRKPPFHRTASSNNPLSPL